MGMFDGETRATGEYISWDKVPIGTSHQLTITTLPRVNGNGSIDWISQANKFNPGQTDELAFIGGLDPDGIERILTMRRGSTIFEAIAAACQTVGADLQIGGVLKVRFAGEKDTGKGNPLKLYDAKYTAPVASVKVAGGDDW